MDRSNAWRKKHKSIRNFNRQKNYRSSRPQGPRRHRPFSDVEIDLILDPGKCTDRMIGEIFNRSVQAIQTKRYSLKKEINNA